MTSEISQLSNGLYQVKPQGAPARVFYKQEQAEKFLKNYNNKNLAPLSQDTVQIKEQAPKIMLNEAGSWDVKYPNEPNRTFSTEADAHKYTNHRTKTQQATNSQKPIHTWSNYAQEHGTVYHKPPESGVVRADEIAAQRIAENAAKQQATVVQPQATSPTPVTTSVPPETRATAPTKPTTTTAVAEAPTPKVDVYEAYAQNIKNQNTNGIHIDYNILDKNKATTNIDEGIMVRNSSKVYPSNKPGEYAQMLKENPLPSKPESLAQKAEGWWNSLKASIEKNPKQWGIGAAVAAGVLALLALNGKTKEENA